MNDYWQYYFKRLSKPLFSKLTNNHSQQLSPSTLSKLSNNLIQCYFSRAFFEVSDQPLRNSSYSILFKAFFSKHFSKNSLKFSSFKQLLRTVSIQISSKVFRTIFSNNLFKIISRVNLWNHLEHSKHSLFKNSFDYFVRPLTISFLENPFDNYLSETIEKTHLKWMGVKNEHMRRIDSKKAKFEVDHKMPKNAPEKRFWRSSFKNFLRESNLRTDPPPRDLKFGQILSWIIQTILVWNHHDIL